MGVEGTELIVCTIYYTSLESLVNIFSRQGLPSVIQTCLILFAPESPRWLISKGRESEALNILAYYHADGNKCVSIYGPIIFRTKNTTPVKIRWSSMSLKKLRLP